MGQKGGPLVLLPLSHFVLAPLPSASAAHIPQRVASSASLATWVLSWVSCALSPYSPVQPIPPHPPPRKPLLTKGYPTKPTQPRAKARGLISIPVS